MNASRREGRGGRFLGRALAGAVAAVLAAGVLWASCEDDDCVPTGGDCSANYECCSGVCDLDESEETGVCR